MRSADPGRLEGSWHRGVGRRAPGTHAGRFNSGRQPAVRVTAMFWHFVDIVWLLMFIAVYLI